MPPKKNKVGLEVLVEDINALHGYKVHRRTVDVSGGNQAIDNLLENITNKGFRYPGSTGDPESTEVWIPPHRILSINLTYF